MASITVPNVETPVVSTPVNLTPTAIGKVREIMSQQNPVTAGLRIAAVGVGCSGFSYSMSFENAAGVMDKLYHSEALKLLLDPTSAMHVHGCIVDYLERVS